MDKNNTFLEIVDSKRPSSKDDSRSVPVGGGRTTLPESGGTLENFIDGLYVSEPDFNIKLLDALETLARYHPDLSHAVSNIKELGHTNYSITFDDNVPDTIQSKMKKRIKTKTKESNDWYSFSGGVGVLINDLFSQLAISGALSAEIIPEDDLSGVKKVAKVSPKDIRFVYDKVSDSYEPYQDVMSKGKVVDGGMVRLNPITYKYSALSRVGDKPYALPPFLSALENLAIGKDMQENFKYVVKKLGTMGFLEVLVNAPKSEPNESDSAYYTRTKSYLDRILPEIEKGLSKGYVAGFKGMHSFEMHSTSSDVKGSEALNDMNDTKVMSGLKQDPLMLGRSFNVSETLGRVILAKMSRQIVNYQKEVAGFLESLFLMDLQLAGYPIDYLNVEFDAPMIGDNVKNEQAQAAKLKNLGVLLSKGVISIDTYAMEAGYDEVDDPDKHLSGGPIDDGEDDDEDEPTDGGDGDDGDGGERTDPDADETEGTDVKSSIRKLELSLNNGLDEFQYISESHPKPAMSFAKGDPTTINEFVAAYYNASSEVYSEAVVKATKQIAEALSTLGKGASQQEVTDRVIYTLYNNWDNNFKAPQRKVVNSFVSSAYRSFRKDKAVFGADADNIPNSTFNAVDRRAIDYYKRSDSMYLGKFITDDSTKAKITKFIKEKHLTRELPIGNNPKSVKAFQKEFGKTLGLQDWKVRQIVDTSVNNMRNTASINYMKQANVTTYEIIGISDKLQCPYCASMQHKQFSIKKASQHIENTIKSDPAYVSVDTPFITSIYKDPEDVKNTDSSKLQAQGLDKPSYHPYCRDRVVAVIG